MTESRPSRFITLSLESPDELFTGPAPGTRGRNKGAQADWDAMGAILGEPGVDRLLRLLHLNREAREIVIRVTGQAMPTEAAGRAKRDKAQVVDDLHAWLRARTATNRLLASTSRRFGARMLALCTLVLGAILIIAWVLQSDVFLGPTGPVRTLIAEALIIAGWVVMWRPIELIVFDPLSPMVECRLLSRALQMPVSVEFVESAVASPAA